MVEQVLIVEWDDGKIKKYRRSNWSDLFDLREQYADNPKVTDTRLEYDI